VNSIFVIIGDVISNQPAQMNFVENDYVVKQLSAAASNPALSNPSLPRASETDLLWLNAAGNEKVGYLRAEL
jgi:hypothetical protein